MVAPTGDDLFTYNVIEKLVRAVYFSRHAKQDSRTKRPGRTGLESVMTNYSIALVTNRLGFDPRSATENLYNSTKWMKLLFFSHAC